MIHRIILMRLTSLFCAGLLGLVVLTPGYSYQSTRRQRRTINAKPSNIWQEVSARKKQQPSITTAELVRFANELVAQKGFDFDFEVSEFVPKRKLEFEGESTIVPARFSLADGSSVTLNLTVENPKEAMCGEASSHIPVLRVSKTEMLLVSEGKPYRVRRPRALSLESAELVDASFKKVFRSWPMPYQIVPSGISADGRKLYLPIYSQFELDNLVMEVSEGGQVAFRDAAEVKSKDELLENAPKDPNNGYLSFLRFQVDGKSYIVKFLGPCT